MIALDTFYDFLRFFEKSFQKNVKGRSSPNFATSSPVAHINKIWSNTGFRSTETSNF